MACSRCRLLGEFRVPWARIRSSADALSSAQRQRVPRGLRSPVLPASCAAERGSTRRSVDVAIVGAGFAGLTAAVELQRPRQVGSRARGPQSRRGARPQPSHRRRRDLGGGATFVGPTQGHILAAREAVQGRQVPDLRHRRQRLRQATGQRSTYSDTARPGSCRRTRRSRPIAQVVAHARTRCRPRFRSTRRGRRSSRRVGRADARDVGADAPATARTRASGAWSPSRRGRSSAPSRARSRSCSRSSTSPPPATSSIPGTFERNFSTRDGRADVAVLRRDASCSRRRWRKALGDRVVLRSPVTGIVQGDGRVTVHSERLEVSAKRVIVAVPPTLAGRIHYQPANAARPRPADPAPAAGDADEGRGRLRQAVLARRGPEWHRAVS